MSDLVVHMRNIIKTKLFPIFSFESLLITFSSISFNYTCDVYIFRNREAKYHC